MADEFCLSANFFNIINKTQQNNGGYFIMSSISKDRREERLRASYVDVNILSDRAYNIALGGVVFMEYS